MTVLPGGRIRQLVERVRGSYWFIPALMTVGAVGLALGMLDLDRRVDADWTSTAGWLYQGGADGAREVLSTIAGSMITVAGVTFSITIVVLSLAASQYGPRILQNFLRDTGTEVVLGTFLATFLYCLLILRTIQGSTDESPGFVPQLSVTMGVVTAVVSLGVLIYFIHHVAALIRVDHVITLAADDLAGTLRAPFPGQIGRDGPDDPAVLALRGDAAAWIVVEADAQGYVEDVDGPRLLAAASEARLVVDLCCRPGSFVAPGTPLARVRPEEPGAHGAGGRRDADLERRLRGAFLLGTTRTPLHDLLAAVDRLVEIAARALSPSLNDPFTAIACLDRLGHALETLVTRDPPARCRYDGDGRLRVVAVPVSVEEALAAVFDRFRVYGRTQPDVLHHLFEVLRRVARVTKDPAHLALLARHAEALLEEVDRAEPTERDRRRLRAFHAEVAASLPAALPDGVRVATPRPGVSG